MSNGTERPVARLVPDSQAHNTLNKPPEVSIFFQRSPQFPASGGPPRGIEGLDFKIIEIGIDGKVVDTIVSKNPTGPDGRIDVPVPVGGSSTLQLLFRGTVMAEYKVVRTTEPLKAAAELEGLQQRLRMMGYQIGHTGTAGGVTNDGVDDVGPDTQPQLERSILDFQVDEGFLTNVKALTTGTSQPKIVNYNLDDKTLQKLVERAGG